MSIDAWRYCGSVSSSAWISPTTAPSASIAQTAISSWVTFSRASAAGSSDCHHASTVGSVRIARNAASSRGSAGRRWTRRPSSGSIAAWMPRSALSGSPPVDAALEVVGHLVEVAGERAGAERYFQPPSGSSATIVPEPIRCASRAAATSTAPHDGPPKIPSRSTRSRSAAIASRFADEVLRVEHRRVEDLGHEPVVERAQALDLLAGQRLGGDDPDARLVLAAGNRPTPISVPPVPSPATNTSISGQSARISGPVVS